MTLSEQLALFCSRIEYAELSAATKDGAQDCVIDWFATALSGSRSTEAKYVDNVVRALQSRGTATTFTGMRTAAPLAALVNGTSAHAEDFDDTNFDAMIHTGASVVAAAFAVSESVTADGKALLAGVAAGYEAAVRIAAVIDSPPRMLHHKRGFHPTGTCGVFGAAVAAGTILQLDAERLVQALGICGSFASGIMEFFSDGSMTKRIHPGKAAHDGVMAALLAREGYTGPRTVLEGRDGFFRAYGDGSEPDRLLAQLGTVWQVERASRKLHACCAHIHASIDALQRICTVHQVVAADIASIDVELATMAAYQVIEPLESKRRPTSTLEAQMSLPYVLAAVLEDGNAMPAQFTPERVADPRLHALMDRIGGKASTALDAVFSSEIMPAIVSVRTREGRHLTDRVDHPAGSVRNPLTRAQLKRKFDALATASLTSAQADALWGRLTHISDLDSVTDLTGR
ncbi:MAG: MmgE/PrpD family protein [Betaproteobacteria bacterium]